MEAGAGSPGPPSPPAIDLKRFPVSVIIYLAWDQSVKVRGVAGGLEGKILPLGWRAPVTGAGWLVGKIALPAVGLPGVVVEKRRRPGGGTLPTVVL